MMSDYIENPKTAGSGIVCAIPQTGECPNGCEDCFFQSGRSYLEPLADNLPNLPSPEQAAGRVVRVNDGNDSNKDREVVCECAYGYPMHFFNTATPWALRQLRSPVVLTVNPGEDTDVGCELLEDPPLNLMFVRVRTNTWNLGVVDEAVEYYTEREVPVVLTFMAYFNRPAPFYGHESDYIWRKRTLNSYWAITTDAWRAVMDRYADNVWVHSCGKVEGERGSTKCRHCGNCLREYFATMERIRAAGPVFVEEIRE